MPELWDLADAIPEAVTELLEAVKTIEAASAAKRPESVESAG